LRAEAGDAEDDPIAGVIALGLDVSGDAFDALDVAEHGFARGETQLGFE
jgi:hypothetical protein